MAAEGAFYVYGDPAAGRAWAIEVDGFMKSLGAETTDMDPNLGRIDHELGRIFYAKYVDEFIGCGSTDAVVEWLKTKISDKYAGCTHGPWATVLGFGVTRDRKQRTVSVDATRLIRDLAKRRGISTGDKAG